MEYLIVRLVEIENRTDITNEQGQIVGADVKFKFLEDRNVIIGGRNQGTTNQTIELDMGTHTVSLGVPKDFTPKNMKIVLGDTTVFSPMEVRFEKI